MYTPISYHYCPANSEHSGIGYQFNHMFYSNFKLNDTFAVMVTFTYSKLESVDAFLVTSLTEINEKIQFQAQQGSVIVNIQETQ
jgi:uncharacterized protein (UPF0332 family)